MRFLLHGFGSAVAIYNSKAPLKAQIELTLHGLNVPLGYKISATLPDQIKEAFVNSGGWQKEVPSRLKEDSQLARVGDKSVDLRNLQERVDIEIERGNVASLYRDVFKFNIHKKADIIDLGIVIAPVQELSLTFGENIAWYERIQDELSISWKYTANADCPILLIGLQPYSYPDGMPLIDQESVKKLEELKKSRGTRGKYPVWRRQGQSMSSLLD